MGLVSKHGLVDIMPNFYAMSRYGLRKLYFGCKKVIFSSYFAVNRTRFSAQLAYGKMTLLNFSFLFRRYKVKFWCCFIVAKGFHFPKHPFVLNFHSLLTHLLRFESAVLLFDCGRNKPAAENIPQLFLI